MCIRDRLNALDIDWEVFCRMITGRYYEPNEKPWLNPLIAILNSWMDVDKIDYILRDSTMSGAVLAIIDKERILSAYDIKDDQLILSKAGFSVVSQLVYGRESLYLWLYTHHAVAYYQHLIKRFLKYLISQGFDIVPLFSLESLADGIDDSTIYDYMRDYRNLDEYTKLLWKQLYSRQYYKPLWKTPFECREKLSTFEANKLFLNPGQLEKDIIEKFSFPPDSVFVHEASFKTFESDAGANIWVSVGRETSRFDEKFHRSIYKDPKIIQKTPYIRVHPDLVGRREEIISFVKSWKA